MIKIRISYETMHELEVIKRALLEVAEPISRARMRKQAESGEDMKHGGGTCYALIRLKKEE